MKINEDHLYHGAALTQIPWKPSAVTRQNNFLRRHRYGWNSLLNGA